MKLPAAEIVTLQPDEAVLALSVAAQDEAFDGHFPGHPVLPGVVQIDWAVRFAAQYLNTAAQTGCDLRIKFRHVIRPDMPLGLHLTIDRKKHHLLFSYRSQEIETASGRIRLDG